MQVSPIHLNKQSIVSRWDKMCAHVASPLHTEANKAYPGMGTIADIVSNGSLIGFGADLLFKGIHYKDGENPSVLSWLRSAAILGFGFALPKVAKARGNKVLATVQASDKYVLFGKYFPHIHESINSAFANKKLNVVKKLVDEALLHPEKESSVEFFKSIGLVPSRDPENDKLLILDSVSPYDDDLKGSAKPSHVTTEDRYYGIRIILNSIKSYKSLVKSSVNLEILSRPKNNSRLNWTSNTSPVNVLYSDIDFYRKDCGFIDVLKKRIEEQAKNKMESKDLGAPPERTEHIPIDGVNTEENGDIIPLSVLQGLQASREKTSGGET